MAIDFNRTEPGIEAITFLISSSETSERVSAESAASVSSETSEASEIRNFSTDDFRVSYLVF